MEDYTYKCIPLSQNVSVGKKGDATDTAKAYEALINSAALDGWEYDKTVTTNTFIPAGCFASIFGSKPQNIRSNILVFKKRIVTQTIHETIPIVSYNDSNLLSEMNTNKMEVLEELRKMNSNLEKLINKPAVTSATSESTNSSRQPVTRMTMEEYLARKAADKREKKVD